MPVICLVKRLCTFSVRVFFYFWVRVSVCVCVCGGGGGSPLTFWPVLSQSLSVSVNACVWSLLCVCRRE